jgi:hypothetical protein
VIRPKLLQINKARWIEDTGRKLSKRCYSLKMFLIPEL